MNTQLIERQTIKCSTVVIFAIRYTFMNGNCELKCNSQRYSDVGEERGRRRPL